MVQKLAHDSNFTDKDHHVDKVRITKMLEEKINKMDKRFSEVSKKAAEYCFEHLDSLRVPQNFTEEKCNQDLTHFFGCHNKEMVLVKLIICLKN